MTTLERSEKIQTPGGGGGGRFGRRPLIAGVTALSLGLSGVLLTGGAAFAAPGTAEASARYLSGTLLERSLDNVAAVEGETALAGAGTPQVVTESGDLELSVLSGLLGLQVADGVNIPLTLADAGVVGQYAQATQQGDARAATGLITDDGTIDVNPTTGVPGPLTLDLSQLIGTDAAASVANLQLSMGATTATAEKLGAAPAAGDYAVAGLTATATSPVVATLGQTILEAGGAVEGLLATTLGADGTLAGGLGVSLSLLGIADVDVAASVDLDPVLQDVLVSNQLLGVGGPVQVDLLTGAITVDIQALLEANGRDLNALAPGEDILTSELVGFITADVDELVNGLLGEVQSAVATTLAATNLTVNAVVGDPEAPVLALSLDGSLGAINSGEVVSEITLLDTEFDTSLLNGLISGAVGTVLSAQLDTSGVDGLLDGLYPVLDLVLTSLVRLQANVQETEADVFTETALRLTVLNFTDEGQLLELNLAQAAVGPTAAPTADTFTFTPASGPEAGGTEVTLTGEDLTEVTEVLFGDTPAASVEEVTANEIVAVSPPGTGAVAITVEQGDVTSTSSALFTYLPEGPGVGTPTLLALTPSAGPEIGGTPVTITGTELSGVTSVLFGDAPATAFTVVSPTEIAATTPAGVGTVDVTVGKPGGVTGTLADAFTYVPASTDGGGSIVSIAPASGPEEGGTAVTIIGGGFTGTTEVTFGDDNATSFVVVSDNQIIATSPGGEGSVTVTVVTPTGPLVSPTPFTYVPDEVNPPGETPGVVASVTPTSGPEMGGTVVTIIGAGFTGADGVLFGTASAGQYAVVSDSVVIARTPAGTGTVPITVVGTSANGDIPSAVQFTYIPAPVVTTPVIDGVEPNTGSTTGGTVVTITGDNFTNVTEVYFGDTEAPVIEVVSDTEVRATTPAGTAGTVDVRVVRDDGASAALEDGFRYVAATTGGGNTTGNNNGTTATTAGGTDKLARTGSEAPTGGLVAAVLMLLTGAGAFAFGRRRGLV